MEEARLVVEKSQPVVSYLEAVLSVPVRIRYVANYADIIELFAKGEIDTAYLGAFSYVALKQYYPYANAQIAQKYVDLGLKVLDKTEHLPLSPIVVNNQTLSAEQKSLITDTLLNAPAELRQVWGLGRDGFVPVTDRDYNVIRQIRAGAHVN